MASVLTARRIFPALALLSATFLASFPVSAQSIDLPLPPGIEPDVPDLGLSVPSLPTVELDLPGLGLSVPLLPGIELDLPDPLSEAIIPILDGLELPAGIVDTIDALCPSPPLSSECGALLQSVGVQAPTAQQIIANASAAVTLQTNVQVTDFALSGGLLPPSQSAAVLQTLSPTVTTFGISGVSHTSHDGFQIEGPIGGRTLGFDSLDIGVTLGFRVDASKAINQPADTLTLGFFGNYTNSDIDVDSTQALRELGLTNAGDATLNNGSAGGYVLLTNGLSMDWDWLPENLARPVSMMVRLSRRILTRPDLPPPYWEARYWLLAH